MNCGIIASVSRNWVIGVDNKIPWDCPEDLKRFREITEGSTIIMGRNTWESLPHKPLKGRRNIVITSGIIENVDTYKSISEALISMTTDNVWFIGGKRIFSEGLKYSNVVNITMIDIIIEDKCAIYFPLEDLEKWLR
jgi:dihydrofolate reductase